MSNSNADLDDGTVKEALHPSLIYSASSVTTDQTTRLNALCEQVDQRVAQPKTLRNTVAATSSLPPEILSKIFIVLRRMIDANGIHYESDMSWIRVTHVCRYWKAAALDCSALWSDLRFVNPAITKMMLQRSKNAPLTVHFDTARPLKNVHLIDSIQFHTMQELKDAYSPSLSGTSLAQYQDILCKIASQTGRLRDVELRTSRSTVLVLPKILSNFESTAPILERLVLEGATLTYAEHTLPETFLQDGAPSLRHLELLRFAIPSRWDALPLSSTLTYLRLQNAALKTRPARKPFLESMGQLLQLETLRLIKYLPCSRDVSHPSGRSLPISLPSLRTLELDDSTAEVHHFFNATQISKEAKVGLALTDEDSVFGSLGALFSALKASWILSSQDMDVDTNGSQLPAQSDILDLRTVEEIQIGYSGIKCWFKHNKLPTKFDDDNPPADLVVSADNIITTSLLTAIADSSDLSSLRSLKISSYDDLEEDGLALFKNLTKLDTIAICDNYETLSIFLKEFQKQGSDTTSPSFPALRSVHLHNIDFDGPLVRKPDDAVRALVTAFENREASHPIEQLTISKCINFSEVHWKDLCASSFSEDVNMDWDEDEYIHDYYDDYDDHDFDTYGYGSD